MEIDSRCNIGELKIFYRGKFNYVLVNELAETLSKFDYELSNIGFISGCNIVELKFHKPCG